MKKLSILIFIVWLFSVSAFAQEQEKQPKIINKLLAHWQCDDVIARLDNFQINLQRNPQYTGFIFAYEGKYIEYESKNSSKVKTFLPKFGEINFRIQIIRNHFKFRGYNLNKIMFINGGFREYQEIELWIVPKGIKPPNPTPTKNEMTYRKGKPFWECDI